LNLTKGLVYTRGTNDFNTRNKPHINLIYLHQDRFQSIQDFSDEYLAIKKVCDVLELLLADVKVMQGQC